MNDERILEILAEHVDIDLKYVDIEYVSVSTVTPHGSGWSVGLTDNRYITFDELVKINTSLIAEDIGAIQHIGISSDSELFLLILKSSGKKV